VRVGSERELGDLNSQWSESRETAQTRPDLAALEQGVIEWFSGQ
jgi:hypothetical protein